MSQKNFFILLSGLAVALWFGFLLSLYSPGLFNGYGWHQWMQAGGRIAFDDRHGVLYSILMIPFARLGLSPVWFMCLQIGIVVAVFMWALKSTLEIGLPLKFCLVFPLWFMLIPIIPVYTISTFSDPLYSSVILAMSVQFARVIFQVPKNQTSEIRVFMFLSLILCFLKKNGFLVSTLVLVAFLFCLKLKRQERLMFGFIYLGLFIGLRVFLYGILSIDSRTTSELVLPHHLAAHLANGNVTSQDQRELLAKIRPIEDNWSYDCASIEGVVFNKDFNFDAAKTYSKDLWWTWMGLAIKYPLTEIQHDFCVSQLIWNPLSTPKFIHLSSNKPQIYPNGLGINENSWNPRLRNTVSRVYRHAMRMGLFSRPALILILIVFLGIHMAIRTKDFSLIMISFPMMLHSLVLILANTSQQLRFQLPVYFVFPFLLGFYVFRLANQSHAHA